MVAIDPADSMEDMKKLPQKKALISIICMMLIKKLRFLMVQSSIRILEF